MILDPYRFARSLGGADKINGALDVLQQAARAHGLPGVFVVGDFFVGNGNPPDAAWMFRGQDFDAVSQYGYPGAAGLRNGPEPYAELVLAAGERNWDLLAETSGLPYIPDITAGWDGRPNNESTDGYLWWLVRSPEQVATFVADAVKWSRAHPAEVVEPTEERPLVFVEAWNELGEGSFLVPNSRDGSPPYAGRSLARSVCLGPDPAGADGRDWHDGRSREEPPCRRLLPERVQSILRRGSTGHPDGGRKARLCLPELRAVTAHGHARICHIRMVTIRSAHALFTRRR